MNKQSLIDHIEKEHASSIPDGWNAARFENYLRTGKTEGHCIYCKKITGWNNATGKYNRMCGEEACKKKAYELAQKNYIGLHGKPYSINNPEQQKKMVYGKKSSGKYVFVDEETGKKYEAMYDSSYGKDFFEMIDTFLSWDGADIIAPSPHTYYYNYEGQDHFYIPDAYSTSLNLEIELKDGGDNPNKHPKIQAVDKVKERLKDQVMDSLKGQVNYIKICNKDYSEFFAMLSRLKAEDNCPLPKWESKLEPSLEAVGVTKDVQIFEGVDHAKKKLNIIGRNRALVDPMLNYDDLIYTYRNKIFHENLNEAEWIQLENELNNVSDYLKGVINRDNEEDSRMRYEAKKALKEINRFLDYMNNGGQPAFEATIEGQKLFHISEQNLDGHTLRPTVPSNFMTENGYEDNRTKRVCFCPTVDDCITALSQNCAGKTYYVHQPVGQHIYHDTQNTNPQKPRYVPDCHITHEKWIEEPVKLMKIGIIHVISVKRDEGTIYEYGEDKVAKLYEWLYEWEEQIVESAKDPVRPVIHKPDLTEAGEELDYRNVPNQMAETATVLTEGFKPKGRMNLKDFLVVPSDSPVVKKLVEAGVEELKFVSLSKDGSVWLDRKKNKVVAMVALDTSKHPYWIYDLVVGEDYRGYGLGNQVLDYAVKELGGEALTVRQDNDIAIRMYKKYGFVEKKVSDGKPGMKYMYLTDNDVIMELSLSSTMIQDFQAKGSRQLSEFTKMAINKTTIDKYKVRYPHLKHIRVDGANGYLWFEQNELVAYVAVDFGGSKKWIQALYVSPDYRGYGLSKQLLKIAENELNATHLSVAKNNEVAINLYKKNGWKEDTSIDKSEHMLFMTNGRGIHLPITESQIFNDKDIYYNKEAFDNGDINICFITGLSGSGKTTMAGGITKDFYQLDDLLIQQNFSDENLKEYGPVISGFFNGPGKEFRKLKSAEEYTEEIERKLIRGFVSYAIKYASSHKNEKIIVEGVELYWVYEPNELKDYAVYIKGTSSLLSQIRSAIRDSADAKGRIGRFIAFLQIMTHKGRASAYADSEKKIKKWLEYFSKQSVTESTNLNVSKVYYTNEITPESLVQMYHVLGVNLPGKVAVKISTGEPGGHNFLQPSLIKDLIKEVNGTIVECNTAYPGKRNTPEDHWKAIKDHGFADIAPCILMDEYGEISIPVKDGFHLTENFVGKGLKEFDSMIVLSHFKGHAMAGYGGALKNMSIGIASAHGKTNIHTAGTGSTFDELMSHDRSEFQESMADADKSVMEFMGPENIVYINVANKLSVDCDCDAHPHDPEMGDIGIFASTDPIAVDQACIDAVYKSNDNGKYALIERIESRKGIHTIEAAHKLGLGNREYELTSSVQEASYIEAMKDEGRYFPVFIFLSYTGSNMAKLIKAFTHDPYAHSSISFDTNLDNMVSFNRDGMVVEDINKSVYKKNAANVRYSLYMYMATAQEYDSIRNFVGSMLDKRIDYKYNVLGLTNFIFGRGSEREDKFFCSEFVASAINAGNRNLIKTQPYLTSPYHFAKNQNFIFIKTGILKNYDVKVIDKLVEEKIEEGGFKDVVIR